MRDLCKWSPVTKLNHDCILNIGDKFVSRGYPVFGLKRRIGISISITMTIYSMIEFHRLDLFQRLNKGSDVKVWCNGKQDSVWGDKISDLSSSLGRQDKNSHT